MDTESLVYIMTLEEKIDKVAETLGTLGGGTSVLEMLRGLKEEGGYGNTRISDVYMIEKSELYFDLAEQRNKYRTYYEGSVTVTGKGVLDCIIVARRITNTTSVSIKIDGNEKHFGFNSVNSSEYIEDYLPLSINFERSLEIKIKNNHTSDAKVLYRLKE